MGCASSKQARREYRNAASPLPRSYSLPVHHPAQSEAESYHVVALASTTLGSIKLDSLDQISAVNLNGTDHEAPLKKKRNSTSTTTTTYSNNTIRNTDFATEVFQAKTWSNMIEEKIPKMPPRTPPHEPETINTWELMEGLEDYSPLRVCSSPNTIDRSFSFHTVRDTEINKCHDQKQLTWLQMKPSDSIVADFDPEIISTFRKALEELSPRDRFLLRSPQGKISPTGGRFLKTGFVRARVSAFQERIDAKKAAAAATANKCPPRGEEKVVLYFTSLRGVRKTYEDCCAVRMILKGFGVHVDERDVSLHNGFREELRDILGKSWGSLPRVFAKGKYLGGVEEVRGLHEEGELGKALEGCEMSEGGGVCEGCGDVTFVSCDKCHGSCKVYVEEEEEEGGDGGGFVRCWECNENGIVRCPVCCY